MEKRDVMFAIGFITIVLLLLSSFLLFFFLKFRLRNNKFILERETMKKNFEQTLLQSQVEVQEDTFTVLAKELHDNIGQLLSSCKMLIGITQINMNPVPEPLTIAEETIGKAIVELRSLSKSLDKQWLQQFDLIDNLSTEIKRINSSTQMQIHFQHPGKLFLTPDKQIILFRIIQEALQNAIKHSYANEIHINIENAPENIMIQIEDNGNGFTHTSQNGMGIQNMKHRTKQLGGSIIWQSPGTGSLIIIQLPIKEDLI